MIQEATKRQYSAVICQSCREPIPVPAIVTNMERAAASETDELDRAERVFKLRCRACECEKPYRSSQIVEVEGEPKGRRVSADSVYRHGALSRAANA
jgi:hypothetical protein